MAAEAKKKDLGVVLNQEDLLGTLLTFTITVFEVLETFGQSWTADEQDAYLHLWDLVGAHLSIGAPAAIDELEKMWEKKSSDQLETQSRDEWETQSRDEWEKKSRDELETQLRPSGRGEVPAGSDCGRRASPPRGRCSNRSEHGSGCPGSWAPFPMATGKVAGPGGNSYANSSTSSTWRCRRDSSHGPWP